MDTREGIGIGCRKTDSVASWMAKFSTESMPDENSARRSIDLSSFYSRGNLAQSSKPGLSNCAFHMLLLLGRALYFNNEGTQLRRSSSHRELDRRGSSPDRPARAHGGEYAQGTGPFGGIRP